MENRFKLALDIIQILNQKLNCNANINLNAYVLHGPYIAEVRIIFQTFLGFLCVYWIFVVEN